MIVVVNEFKQEIVAPKLSVFKSLPSYISANNSAGVSELYSTLINIYMNELLGYEHPNPANIWSEVREYMNRTLLYSNLPQPPINDDGNFQFTNTKKFESDFVTKVFTTDIDASIPASLIGNMHLGAWYESFSIRDLVIRDDLHGSNKQYRIKNSVSAMDGIELFYKLFYGGCRDNWAGIQLPMPSSSYKIAYKRLAYTRFGTPSGAMPWLSTVLAGIPNPNQTPINICNGDPYTNEPMDPTLIANFFDTEDYTSSCPDTIASDDKEGLIEAYKSFCE